RDSGTLGSSGARRTADLTDAPRPRAGASSGPAPDDRSRPTIALRPPNGKSFDRGAVLPPALRARLAVGSPPGAARHERSARWTVTTSPITRTGSSPQGPATSTSLA